MHADNFDLQAYLDRIGFVGAVRADFATVDGMMRRQLRTVPFENLDVQAGKGVSLVPEDLVDKLVGRRRGGYCYEINGLFALALTALGISWRFVAARPMLTPERRPRTHMALLVRLDGEDWLCDLGFGAYGIHAPMRLADIGVEVPQDDDCFMLEQPNAHEYRLRSRGADGWSDLYGFDLSDQDWIDFMPANHFSATHPNSLFVQKLLVTRLTDTGRIVLFDGQFKVRDRAGTTARPVEPDETASILRDMFGLDVE